MLVDIEQFIYMIICVDNNMIVVKKEQEEEDIKKHFVIKSFLKYKTIKRHMH